MTNWWYCGNEDCSQFEGVASADTPPLCPICAVPMLFVEENDLTQLERLKPIEVPE